MSVVKLAQIAAIKITDPDSNSTVEAMSTTDNTTGYALQVNNQNNTVDVFTKLWARNGAPVIGTNDPDFMFKTPAGCINFVPFGRDMTGIAAGASSDWYAVTTTSGAGNSATSPAKTVEVTLWTAAV